ncbi:MAG TPA: TolC family protein [Deltaproteobacteria bacterium]|nr:TolC family protein [Deltaproteobacteria bacterium]HQB39307.1 TolC family protein [Deltaproteobacteria bacterium]
MRNILFGTCLVVSLLSLSQPVVAATQTEISHTQLLTLDDCIRMALKAPPELGEAQADIDFTASKLEEAKSHRYPQIEVISMFGPAPTARKEDLMATDHNFFRFNRLTWFARADGILTQPLYTFGKISENMKAATHGIEVDRSRKQQKANEIVLKVREYYYGLLYAREMKELVLEVQESLLKARKTAQKLLDAESNGVDQMDIFKLDAFSNEAQKYLEEAHKGERLALSALRARLGLKPDAKIDIAAERLLLPDRPVPELETLVDRARDNRPEFRQISEGLKARTALVEAAKANYYPDVFLAGLLSWAYSPGRDKINNPYIHDNFNHYYGGAVLGVRWKLDFGITGSKVSAERAQHNRLLHTRDFAEINIPLQVKKFYLELKEAENAAKASRAAYSNAKKWTVSALANFDFGVGPAKDIFEALQAYSRMRAAYFQSVYNYNIALANLDCATSEQLQTGQK